MFENARQTLQRVGGDLHQRHVCVGTATASSACPGRLWLIRGWCLVLEAFRLELSHLLSFVPMRRGGGRRRRAALVVLSTLSIARREWGIVLVAGGVLVLVFVFDLSKVVLSHLIAGFIDPGYGSRIRIALVVHGAAIRRNTIRRLRRKALVDEFRRGNSAQFHVLFGHAIASFFPSNRQR